MGCWNETCGITQLPIKAGDKVRLFVLVSQSSYRGEAGGGTCYPTDLWTPLGIPVQGEYDDYGSIENFKEGLDTKALLSRIKENWIPFEREYEKVPPLDKMDLGSALHWIERGYAKQKVIGKEQSLGAMMVLEEVYQAMISYDFVTAHHTKNGYVYLPYSEILKRDMEEWYQDTYQTYKDLEGIDDDPVSQMQALLNMARSDRFFGYMDSGLKEYSKELTDLAKDGKKFTDKKVQKLAQSVIEMKRFSSALMAARKMWVPQSGKGSQDENLDIHKVIAKTVDDIITQREQHNLSDGGSLPDENGYYSYMIEHNEEQAKKDANAKETSEQVST
jgi:hypothetical protein